MNNINLLLPTYVVVAFSTVFLLKELWNKNIFQDPCCLLLLSENRCLQQLHHYSTRSGNCCLDKLHLSCCCQSLQIATVLSQQLHYWQRWPNRYLIYFCIVHHLASCQFQFHQLAAAIRQNYVFQLPDHELLALWWRWMWCRVWFWFALLFVCAVGEKCLHIFLILNWPEQVNRSWWNIWKSDYEHILTLLTQILRIKVDRCILWTQFFLLWVNLGPESFQLSHSWGC